MSVPTTTQVLERVRQLRKDVPGALAYGITHPEPWSGSSTVVVGDETLPVRACASSLEIREVLLEEPGPVVIVTPLRTDEIEADVCARLARHRLHTIRGWDVVMDALRLRAVDARLTRETWMPEVLRHAVGQGRVSVPSGFLDMDTAWDLVAQGLGLPTGRPDVLDLLRWADVEGPGSLRSASDGLRSSLAQRIRETAGAAGEAILGCLEMDSEDALPLGLVCSVVFSAAAPGEARIPLERAAVRLERHARQKPVGGAAGRVWAAAAEAMIEDTLKSGGLADARPVLQRADALLAEVEAEGFAWLARYSLLGFEQRLARCGEALTGGGDVRDAVASVRAHGLAPVQPDRVDRVEMAARLVRWLSEPRCDVASFEHAAERYLESDGFVDWIRVELDAGDPCPALSAAYGQLLARATEARETGSERFARLLGAWVAASGSLRAAVPIEEILSRVVAPLAADSPVLLLVVDGMSVAVFRALSRDLGEEGWVEIRPAGDAARPVIAALPTVTEVSRASLLAGRLTRGVASDEKASFASHADLLSRTGRRKPPVLFHKGDLGDADEAGLASAVRAEVADPSRKVVGIVVNAVDDHLAKGDQIRPRWGIEAIRPLRTILHAAQEAGRTVVLTSDHGHVPERGSELRSYPEGERWRSDDGAPAAGEVVLAGPRVVIPPPHRLIVPWSERLRYGVKKNGYHGGAAPQEVVVPLGVFTLAAAAEGWEEVALALPSWWTDDAPRTVAPMTVKPARRRPRVAPGQGSLFGVSPDWIDALLASATWKAQVQAAGRVSLDPARVKAALLALDERGGRLTREALATRLGLPAVRVHGFVAALRRVLNVDGYDVLGVDDASDGLVLNRDLLKKQFDL